MHVLIYSCMSKLLQSCIYCNSSPQHDKTCNCNFDSRVTYLIGVLFLIGVFLPDLCVCSSVSVQLSWSQLERKKGVFERDLDLNPLTVGLSIFWTTLKSSYHSLVNIFTGSFSSKKIQIRSQDFRSHCLLHKEIYFCGFIRCRQKCKST